MVRGFELLLPSGRCKRGIECACAYGTGVVLGFSLLASGPVVSGQVEKLGRWDH